MSMILQHSLIYFIFIHVCFDYYQCFKVLNFHELCGDTIYDEAGEVRFDAQEMPSYLTKNKCSVTINPKSDVFTETTQALFYFTKFELSEPCGLMNVTVKDGSLFGGTRLEGLPEYICGHNETLEEKDQFFTTRTDQFTVTFRGGNSWKYLPGNFTIKFIAIKTGGCEGEGVFKCPSNDYCVASDYSCSEDINACGNDLNHCDVLKELQNLLESILQTVKKYVWVLALIFALCVLKSVYKRKRETICGLKDSICSRLSDGSGRREDTSRRSSTQNSFAGQFELVQNEEPTLILPRESPQEILQPDSDISRSLHAESVQIAFSNNDFQSAHSDDLDMTSSETRQINAPPPSYDEVISNTDKYKSRYYDGGF